jgi:hypothetical protein
MNAAVEGVARKQSYSTWLSMHPELREGAVAYDVDRWVLPLLRAWYEATQLSRVDVLK